MTTVQDSIIFGNILSHPPAAAIWPDETRTQYYLDFEKGLARAQARLSIIPQHAADEISKACTLSTVDWNDLRTRTETIGYPILGLVHQLVAHVNDLEPGLGEWAHWGATTQDVTDTATILQLKDTLVIVEEMLDHIVSTLQKLCEEHKATPMAARSNLQQAVPISVGFKFARLLATFMRHKSRLTELRSRLLVLEFGGAAGTLATLSPDGSDALGLQCQEELAKELGLQVPDIAWHTERDRIAEYGFFLAMLTSTCHKFAFDLKLEMQTEVGEMSEPYVKNRGSSSTMPQKRNPIGTAYITSTASTVRQMSAALSESMVGDHERSTGPWEIEWILLPQISTLSCACLRHTKDVLAGLEIHTDAMQKNLELSKGAIVSEAVMMGLAPTIGRQFAHDLVYDLCHEAVKTGKPLVELLEQHDGVSLSSDELRRLCDPSKYLGLSAMMTEKVLAQHS